MNISRPTAKPVLRLGDPADTPATMRVTSPYGPRAGGFHGGIDIGNYVAGDTLVACGDGTVIDVGYLGGEWSTPKPSDAWWLAQPLNPATGQRGGLYGPPSKWDGPVWGGKQVVLDLGSGWIAGYAHADSISVAKGQKLRAGQPIGTVGGTGSAYRQPHLHFGLRYSGDWVDPWPLINGGAHPHSQEDDMRMPIGQPIAQGVVGPGNRLRVDPHTTEGSRVIGGEPPEGIGEAKAYLVNVFMLGVRGQPYSLGGKAGDEYAWVGVFGQTWYVAEPLVTDLKPSSIFPPADCSAQEAEVAALRGRIERAKTANAGAMQAQSAVKVALG